MSIFGRSEPNVGYDHEQVTHDQEILPEYELYERLASRKRQVQESRQRWHGWATQAS
jgi:hypothetical protein